MAGVASLVAEPPAGDVMAGGAGIASWTVNVTGSPAGEVLPAGSVCVAAIVCGPSANADDVQDQAPSSSTVAVHSTVESDRTVTVAPGSPVPEMVGAASWVVEPPAGAVMAG